MVDDRKKFADFQNEMALKLGASEEMFEASKDLVVRLNDFGYAYQWKWFGVPIIQLPADVMATQEVIWDFKPDIIIETGVARGGSVLFMATLLEAMGNGMVIGIDIDIRAHNREVIEEHPMSRRVTLVEGSSTAAETVEAVRKLIPAGARVMAVLDSDHSREHVLAECRAYGAMVTPGGYLVVADTLLGRLKHEQTPTDRSKHWVRGDEPMAAVTQYLGEVDRFEVDPVLNGKLVLSSSPCGYLRCIRN